MKRLILLVSLTCLNYATLYGMSGTTRQVIAEVLARRPYIKADLMQAAYKIYCTDPSRADWVAAPVLRRLTSAQTSINWDLNNGRYLNPYTRACRS